MPDLLERLKLALVGHYTVEREIGRGGMAVVYLAEDLRHGRPVAIKVLQPELSAMLGADRFLREIETAARLNHPHILPLYDSGEVEGLLYYVMPYVEEDSLRDRLDREGQLPVEEAVRLAREVADGLGYAHSEGVIHRDIKPGNVMLSRGHAVIADFGIAKAVDEAGGKRLTHTGVATGSPLYMSPEQARGEQLDGRTDIYSLGCVLYEMLAGEPPFTGGTHASLMARKALESAPALRILRSTVPEAVERTVERALANVPADRFPSADEFASALSERSDAKKSRPRLSRTRYAVLLMIPIAALLWQLAFRAGPAADADLRSIAVLPFESRSSEEGSKDFTDGVHANILTQLSKIGSLTVISRPSVMQYVGTAKSVSLIADELGVATILHGGVQQMGERVQISVQLIDPETDRNLWAATYNEEYTVENVFTIQADVAKEIATALRATLTPEVEARIEARPTEDLEAYSLYQRGRQFMSESGPEGRTDSAGAYFRQAISRDSTFALAHAGLASIYSGLARSHFIDWDEGVDSARAHAERSLELDPLLAEAWSELSLVHMWFDADYEAAERELLRALELNPSSSSANTRYGTLLRFTGRLEEAVIAYKRVRELNPLSKVASLFQNEVLLQMSRFDDALAGAEQTTRTWPEYASPHSLKAFVLMSLGRFDEAISPAKRALELDAAAGWAMVLGWLNYWQGDSEAGIRQALSMIEVNPLNRDTYFFLGTVYTADGRYEDAIAQWDRLVELDPADPFNALFYAYTYARSGQTEKALEILAEVHELEDDPRWTNALADAGLVYGALGDNDRAFELLDQAVQARAKGTDYLRLGLWWLKVDPWSDPLRDDPRFDQLVERISPD